MSTVSMPTVTVAIPCLNEEKHIARVLRTFLDSSYPALLEICLADGGSTDSTLAIVKRIAADNPKVKLFQNTLKIKSEGLNVILGSCRGDIFLIADAHNIYSSDYIERCIEELLRTGARNVGGCQRFVAGNPVQAGIALAAKSILGSGGARYRDPNYNGYADTVFLGCFWVKDLLTLSQEPVSSKGIIPRLFKLSPNEDAYINSRLRECFATQQITNQEAEVNMRFRRQNRDVVYVSSKIKVWYFPRPSFRKLFKQYFKYGQGRLLTSLKNLNLISYRSVLPLLLFWLLVGLLIMEVAAFKKFTLFLGVCFFILMMVLTESIRICLKYRDEFLREIWRGSLTRIPRLPILISFCALTLLIQPFAHALGQTYQTVLFFMISRNERI